MELLTGDAKPSQFRIGLVVSQYNDFVTNRLREGAVDALRAAGVEEDAIVVVPVPGAFEIPQVTRRPRRLGLLKWRSRSREVGQKHSCRLPDGGRRLKHRLILYTSTVSSTQYSLVSGFIPTSTHR